MVISFFKEICLLASGLLKTAIRPIMQRRWHRSWGHRQITAERRTAHHCTIFEKFMNFLSSNWQFKTGFETDERQGSVSYVLLWLQQEWRSYTVHAGCLVWRTQAQNPSHPAYLHHTTPTDLHEQHTRVDILLSLPTVFCWRISTVLFRALHNPFMLQISFLWHLCSSLTLRLWPDKALFYLRFFIIFRYIL